ncbi:MAG TPA: molybdate ABC transporter substrate-binding protein [Polyangia bacterium]|nr:molybdate ABC transporter substrate-binding protein [Polyangia bacterium]
MRAPLHRAAAAAAVTIAGLALVGRAGAAADASGPPSNAPAAGTRALTVFAAASLREPFEALARVFEARHPGVRVAFNFAGSQELRFQLQQGARADVFASADTVHAGALAQQGLIAKPRVFVRNQPVLVVPRANPAGLRAFADLPRARHIVVGAPDVPIGRYTLAMLDNARRVQGDAFVKAVTEHIASRELNVRQVLAKVSLGEADAAIVYRSDAAAAGGAVTAIEIPPGIAVVAEYALAPVTAAAEPALARQWCELLASAEGGVVFTRAGFLPGEIASAPAAAPGVPAPGPRP